MRKKYRLNSNILDELNKTLMLYFNIELTSLKDGIYQISRYYVGSPREDKLPIESPTTETLSGYWQKTDSKYMLCEYPGTGKCYGVRVLDYRDAMGYGKIRVLIEDLENDCVWDLLCVQNDNKYPPLSKLTLRKPTDLNSDKPGTYENPLVNFNLDREIKDIDATGIFYFLGEAVLYTTFDSIYLKKYDENGEPHYEKYDKELSKDNLKEAVSALFANQDTIKRVWENFERDNNVACSSKQKSILQNFFCDRVDEFFKNMKYNRRNYAYRYKLLLKNNLMEPSEHGTCKRPYYLRFRRKKNIIN